MPPASSPDPSADSPTSALLERLGRVRLLALDVDGVLTDGRVVYAGNLELQSFHVADGQALRWLDGAGIACAWITGRGCASTKRRAKELGCELHTQVRDKTAVLSEVQARLGIAPDETLAMGDDLPDLALAQVAGLFAAPSNAAREVRERADLVTTRAGGEGAVRELVEKILQAQGAWEAILARYGQEASGAG